MYYSSIGARGGVVVKALRYKPAGRGFDSRWCHWNISVTLKVKGRFIGLFQHCGRSAYCILTLNKFPHSSPEAPRIIQMRETSTSEGGNYEYY